MTPADIERLQQQAQKLWDALKRITLYATPDSLRKHAGRDYGIDGDEAISMAYENVLTEAKHVIRRIRRPQIRDALKKG